MRSAQPSHRSRAFLSLVALTVACSPGERPSADAPAEAALTPKVLLIGIDGVRPDVLADVPTPNIDALAASGAFTATARTGMPSVSGPGWSSMLTGVWPEKHGVVDNDFTGKRYDVYPDFLTRIEQVRPELATFAVSDWKPLVADDDSIPAISDQVDAKHVLDGYEMGWPEGDARSVELAVEHLSTADPDALFVYLGNPDEVSHDQHSIGQEYRDAIALADVHVGSLVSAVEARAKYAREDWLIIVSTDHGRTADGDHGGDTPEERTIFLLASGPSAVVGTPPDPVNIVDVAVTALAHLGIAIDPAWQLDGKAVGLRR
ncbi:MAG: alkaline phosphatase family protein [Longimicrobiales bacterium]|nr:alkaline phosphatase family protein [Longimicrobiales bacterium]